MVWSNVVELSDWEWLYESDEMTYIKRQNEDWFEE